MENSTPNTNTNNAPAPVKSPMWSTIIFVGVAIIVIALAVIYRPENNGTESAGTQETVTETASSTGAVESAEATAENTTTNTNTNTNTNTKPMLVKTDTVVGTGAEAVSGKKVTVNYTGTLTDGTKFDSSLNPGRTPFTFTLGAQQVIEGWEQGVLGMKVGGKRTLKIPPDLGYGSTAYGPIPANSTLIFEIELLAVN